LSLGNGILELSLDATSGNVRSLRTLTDGREFIDQALQTGLNEFIYVAGTSPRDRMPGGLSTIRPGEGGPLVVSLIAESQPPGAHSMRREYRLVDGRDRLDITNSIDKKPVRDKEAAYFRFPFSVDGPVSRLDLGWGQMRPELDQLPGSCKDFFSIQRWVDISTTDRGVTWTTVEAPLVQLGQITDETPHNGGPSGWKTKTGSSSVLYSFVMNNYWHTNYKADQEGLSSFQYSIRPHGGFDALAAYRFAVERNQPLLTRSVTHTTTPSRLPFFIESGAAAVTSVTPSPDQGGFIVRLYNPTAEETVAKILWRDRKAHRTWRSNFFGEKAEQIHGPVSMGRFEVITLWLER
jgi:hypothetical protein